MQLKSPLLQRPDYLVCTCMAVMYNDIVNSIESGADTYEKLQEALLVGTGCNSCVEEVHQILAQQLLQRKQNKQ